MMTMSVTQASENAGYWLTRGGLREQNRRFKSTGGVSRENRSKGFLPAFSDTGTGAVYLSRFADGRVAPVHVLDGLPAELVTERSASGRVTAVKASICAGFVRNGEFFTREEAANEVAMGDTGG